MYCRYCGNEIGENEKFCSNCGKGAESKSFSQKLYSHDITKLKTQKEMKSPGAAAAIGFFMGWIMLGPVGYIYLGQWNWFWLTFVIQILAYTLTFFIGAYIILPIIFALHQYQMAKDINELWKLDQQGAVVDEAGTDEDYREEV